MFDVATPLTRLVVRYTGFQNLDQLLDAPGVLTLRCSVAETKNRWERFQRELLCDCYDNLCILKNRRVDPGTFKKSIRCPCEGTCHCEVYKRCGDALDRVIEGAEPDLTRKELSSWIVRARAYRAAWLYYANRPTPLPTPVVPAGELVPAV